MKLHKSVRKYIEYELYGYDETVRQLEMLKDDIVQETPLRALGTSGGISKPTECKGLRLVTNRAIVHMERTIRAIDGALTLLPETHKNLFELIYRQGKSWQQVCMELPTSRSSYFRMRRDIVETVALELGLANEA